MKPLSALLAFLALAASSSLHWLLFHAIPQDQEQREAPIDPDPEPEPRNQPIVVIDDPTPESPDPTETETDEVKRVDDAKSPGTAVEPDGGRLAMGGEPRADLLIDYHVEDERAVIAFAAARDFPIVLLDLDRLCSWPVIVDHDLGVRVPPASPSKVSRYLQLPPLSPSSNRLRYSEWCAQARELYRVPRGSHVTLALVIDGDRLDNLGRAALRADCTARGVDPASVTRVCLRPVVDARGARLEVKEIAVERTTKG